MIGLLDATMKVSIIVLAALLAGRLMRRHSAAMRHWVLAAALACAAMAPLLGLAVPSWRMDLGRVSTLMRAPDRLLRASGAAPQDVNGEVTTAIVFPVVESKTDRGGGFRLLTSLWMAGVAAGVCVLLVGIVRLRWLESRSRPVLQGEWTRIAEDATRQYGLRRPPLLLQSAQPALLATWGFRRPRVILPTAADTWTADRIRIVIGHEMAHIRRCDWLLQLTAEVVRCVYWFNPIVWIACRQMREESEQACDDAVLATGTDGHVYASHLLDIARLFRTSRIAWLPAAAIAHPSSLERRVRAMLNGRVNHEPVTPLAAIAVIAAFLTATVPIAGFVAFAQARFATLSGAATDETGAILANATLALSNVRTDAKYEVRTSQSGAFEFVGLPAGDYALEVRVLGFEPLKDAVTVGIGESLQRNVVLKIGTVQETITVIGGPDEPSAPGSAPRVATARAPRQRACPNPAVGGCIGPPIKVKDVRPLYPPTLRESAARGTVLIDGQIGTDGRMKDMRVVSSPHPAFESAALDAVSEWEFTPTTLNGRVVDTRISVSVSFAPAPPSPPQ
jgi:TonB family protein